MRTRTGAAPLSLWALAIPPAVWAAHFLLSYGTVAVWSAKLAGADRSLATARIAIAAYTAVALVGLVALGVRAHRRHRQGGEPPPHDDDTPEDRDRFLGFATLLLCGLSAIAVVYAGLVVAFIRSCR